MDNDCKEYRRNKPQQKFYKPGSGPLRRSCYGLDTKMDSNEIDNGSRRYRTHYGSHYSVNDDKSDAYSEKSVSTNRQHNKKHDQQLYVPRSGEYFSDNDRQCKSSRRYDSSSHYNKKNLNNLNKHSSNCDTSDFGSGPKRDRSYGEYHGKDGSNSNVNYSRHYRQASETRSISPTHCVQEKKTMDHNRDSRSMETTSGRQMTSKGGKPPSGRRNSAGYTSDNTRHKYMVNIDNVPPRFRKKFLEHSGYNSFDNVDQIHSDISSNSLQFNYNEYTHHSASNWSQTLPSRGRGRLRDNENFDKEKFINNYLRNTDAHSSSRSNHSNSYMNLYESSAMDQTFKNEYSNSMSTSTENAKELLDTPNGVINAPSTSELREAEKQDTDAENDSETVSQMSATLDLINLDWTEEVEKHIKLDDVCDSSVSFSQNSNICKTEDIKLVQPKEENKRSGRSRRKDRRSSSRGLRNAEKRERNKKDNTTSVQHEPERPRKDSNVSIQHEAISASLLYKDRERRDSHRSNRSSTIGNSRDDLDRWRSLRSYSREQSTEGRIMSQCNSRDVSSNRAHSPRDHEGFRVPTNLHKMTTWPSGNQKKNNASSGSRTSSVERARLTSGGEGDCGSVAGVGAGGGPGGGEGGTGSRRSRRSAGRRRARYTDGHVPSANVSAQLSSSTSTNWREEILESKRHISHEKYPESGFQGNRLNSTPSEKSELSTSHPGLIMLPQSSIPHLQKDLGRSGPLESKSKTLYDHQNPSKPIIVQTSPTKIDMRLERGSKEMSSRAVANYDSNEAARADRHRALLQEVDRADVILQAHMLKSPVVLAEHWSDLIDIRTFLQNALQRLLMSDLKYCQEDNTEHRFWKILYHNFIETLRKSFPQVPTEDKPKIVKLINTIIDEGNTYFENLVHILEKAYKFNVDDYINDNHVIPPKGLGYVGLALISVQKLYVSLGDLTRYKEQVNETNNYAKSKLWYTKAQQINPKNGRPYNQLAILAIYARRKLDAVYYYMRSLMSSNPFQSARESLLSLFDENRKKYEAAERKRRAAVESTKAAESCTEGASGGYDPPTAGSGGAASTQGRHELWVRPGERPLAVPRLTLDPLATVSSVELNKNFITSYLHVHGKLITKIGMETFHESASVMLRQFRALVHRQPLPMPAARLLQLTALNMFAVETTASTLKGGNSSGERSAWLECALGVSILMFGALVERCCALLPEPINSQHHADALLLLPAIKVWSDWMLCHSSVWNPPPSFDNFNIDNENGPWDWLAQLMNILEALDDKSIELENEIKDGYTCVRLAEDSTLGGFTPLMYIEPAIAWVRTDPSQHQAAEHALRTRKLLFFGTEYLVGVEPPVLRLEYPADAPPRYASAVQRAQPTHPPLQHLMEELEEGDSVSETTSGMISLSEGVDIEAEGAEGADEATRRLLRRKEQLETRKATIERHKQRMQEILHSGSAITEVAVRPRWLVPDTNCFIDHLPLLQAVVAAPAQPYALAVPLVVMTELEGLRKCSRVGGAAQSALEWVSAGGGAGMRLATSRGSLLASRAFTAERDHERATNDDRVLATALNLHANLAADIEDGGGDSSKSERRVREVVLLTDDRNLRVKALAAELPTRDLPSFIQWAGLTPDTKKTQAAQQSEDTTVAC